MSLAQKYAVGILDDQVNLITVSGNKMLPLYRHGDQLIISENAPMKIGDRVFVETIENKMFGGTLLFRRNSQVGINMRFPRNQVVCFEANEVKTFGRVIWASQ